MDISINELPEFVPFTDITQYQNAYTQTILHIIGFIGNLFLTASILSLTEISSYRLSLLVYRHFVLFNSYNFSTHIFWTNKPKNLQLVIVFSISTIIYNGVGISKVNCAFISAQTIFFCFVSLCSCLGLTFERYNLVVLKKDFTKNSFAAYLAATNSYGEVYGLRSSYDICLVLWYKRGTLAGAAFVFACLTTILMPTAFISFAYYKIYHDVKTSGKKLSECLKTETQLKFHDSESNSENISHKAVESFVDTNNYSEKSRVHVEQNELERKVLMQSISICCCFLIGWTPVMVIISHEVILGKPAPVWLMHLHSAGPSFTCLCNPILVYFFDLQIRNTLKNFFRRE
ncbi:hypothetical protein HDU92_002856 [Lobulomyces angularis]|nr:hypothetical protein HDU92_002856 [Lobulomyces angularis]